MIQVERSAGCLLAAGIFGALLAIAVPASLAQTETPKKKAKPKPEPTSAELFAYIRGALLEFSPDDRINDNLEVTIDPTATVLTVKQPDGHCDIFLSALDANTIAWDIYDASDSMEARQPLARLTVVSVAGKNARTCYDVDNQVDQTISGNRARLLFSWGKIPDGSGVQAKMTKALKKLIALSGGSAEKDIFKP
jgi:hypothetical protein